MRVGQDPWTPALAISRILTREGAAVPAANPFRDFIPPHPVKIHAPESIVIRRSLVLVSCFLIMASLAERLPVRSVPEEFLISPVRNDVIYNRSLHIPWRVLCQAANAEWMCLQVPFALPFPLAVVPTLRGRTCLLWVQRFVCFTVFLSWRYQCTAAWMPAGNVWSIRHQRLLPQRKPQVP